MELSPDHVVLPRETYLELQEAAMITSPMSKSERLGSIFQTTAVFTGVALAFTGSVWGWAKAKDWLEERNFQRRIRSGEVKDHSKKQNEE
jgi:hypothetical protein